MQEQGKTDIVHRIRIWKAQCVANEFTYKEVIEKAGLNYDSVINAMGSALKGNTAAISDARMRAIEKITAMMIIEKSI